MADCLISIIIPAYNVENYLDAALNSISSQTQLPDEVILIDDGSTDRTLKVAGAYSLPVPYRILSIGNAGQGNARNIGVNLASSNYVYFFDSDDLLAKDFIKSVKEQIRSKNYPDIVLFSGASFDDGEYRGGRRLNYSRGFSGTYDNRVEFLNEAHAHNGLFCSPCLYVSKKSLWGSRGLAFGPNFLEDDAIFYPLLFACRTFLVVDEVFFLRRNREGSTMTMTPNVSHVDGALNCMEATLRLYVSEGLNAKERWHISKRLERYCISYLLMARAAGSKCSYKRIIDAVKTTRSASLLLKTCLYASRLDTFQLTRKLGRGLRMLSFRLKF